MDFQDLFNSAAIVLIMLIAYFTLITNWNTTYGTTVEQNNLNATNRMLVIANQSIFNLSTTVGNNTISTSGAGPLSAAADLASRGLRIITGLSTLIGLVPDLIRDAGNVIDIPQSYVEIAVYTLIFAFSLVLAYLVLIARKNL